MLNKMQENYFDITDSLTKIDYWLDFRFWRLLEIRDVCFPRRENYVE